MRITLVWLKKQIRDYKIMFDSLTDSDDDKLLKTIWGERINTLKSVLAVVETELGI